MIGIGPSCVVNKGLYSNHFLENKLIKRDEWKEDIEKEFSKVKTLFKGKIPFLKEALESQLRIDFLNPMLTDCLNHYFKVEGKVEGAIKFPDYGLFPNEENANEALKYQGSEDFYKKSIGICEAKAWKNKLDERDPTSKEDKRTPSRQIDEYLHWTEKKWGILTNGKLWRIYYRENAYRNYYYQVNLEEIIESDDIEAFKYFYLFFRRKAFEIDVNEECFLDRVLKGSVDYSKEIGKDIEANVYNTMRILAEGFFEYKGNRLDKETDLMSIQENTLKFLYRLLFIFFAEANSLLDVSGKTRSSKTYAENYSLDALKKRIAKKMKDGLNDGDHFSFDYWDKLMKLFGYINKGTEDEFTRDEFYIPSYNGGLFDPEKNKFLEEKRVSDFYLSQAVNLLATSKNGDGFFDYSSLDIRHLGSIYEGLLEYRLKIAEESMVAVKQKGKEKWIEFSKFSGKNYIDKVENGRIYLATDKGERKATGSYYTPDYIVKYIVHNTLEPIVKEKKKEALDHKKRGSDAILSIKVLDPAMGSGHFLVEVVDFLGQHLLDAVNEDIENKLMPEGEYPDDWARREIVSHCVYGVDLNPMAVELAKVSLWLKTISKDKPLSFLDHRLKLGNSLIGADLLEIAWYPQELLSGKAKKDSEKLREERKKGQQTFEIPFIKAVGDLIGEIDKETDETITGITHKKEIFDRLREGDEYKRLKTIADLYTGLFFDAKPIEKERERWGGYVSSFFDPKSNEWIDKPQYGWPKKGLEIALAKKFFHWELEFPEVFFEVGKLKERPGFDAVVGNPPYDVLAEKEIGYPIDQEKNFFKVKVEYHYGIGNKLNLYRLFIVKGLALTKDKKKFSYIIPMAILGDDQATRTRKWILDNYQIEKIEAFPQKDDPYRRVFFEAKLPTAIVVITKIKPNRKGFVVTHPGRLLEEISKSYKLDQNRIKLLDTHSSSIPLLTEKEWSLCERIFLSNWVINIGDNYHSYQGEINETSMKTFLSKEPIGPEILRGGVVQRYELFDTPKQGEKWYLKFEKYSSEVSDVSRKAHVNSWRLGYQRNSALDNYRRIISTVIPPENHFFDSISYFLPEKGEMYYLLGILNSNLLEFRFRLTSTNNHVNGYEVESLPLRAINFTSTERDRKSYLEKLKNSNINEENVLQEIDSLLPKDRKGNFITAEEKSDVVHDFLAFLAKQMIKMNKQKQEQIKAFKTDLEGITNDDTFNKLQKGKQGSSLYKKKSCKPYVKEGSGKTHTLDDALGWSREAFKDFVKILASRVSNLNEIMGLYDKYGTNMGELVERIKQTIEFIDQIVYKLYGLTDEEIGIVEKSFKST